MSNGLAVCAPPPPPPLIKVFWGLKRWMDALVTVICQNNSIGDSVISFGTQLFFYGSSEQSQFFSNVSRMLMKPEHYALSGSGRVRNTSTVALSEK